MADFVTTPLTVDLRPNLHVMIALALLKACATMLPT